LQGRRETSGAVWQKRNAMLQQEKRADNRWYGYQPIGGMGINPGKPQLALLHEAP